VIIPPVKGEKDKTTHQPTNIKPYIMGILEELQQGLRAKILVRTSVEDHQSFALRPVLTGFLADSPARCKFSNWKGVNAIIACGCCIYQGVPYCREGSTTYYYKGYNQGTEQDKHFNPPINALVGDKRLLLSDKAQEARAELVELGLGDPKKEGCHGESVICKELRYTSYNNLWLLPLAHALLYGIIKTLIAHLLRPTKEKESKRAMLLLDGADFLDLSARRIMEERGKHVCVPSDYGRQYKCVVQYHNSYKMEDWFHFVESFSAYILDGLLSPVVQRMWECLVKVVEHFMRPDACETRKEYFDYVVLGARHLREYSNLLDMYKFPEPMFTYNTHILTCRLGIQALV
jgi:hypothetical protein